MNYCDQKYWKDSEISDSFSLLSPTGLANKLARKMEVKRNGNYRESNSFLTKIHLLWRLQTFQTPVLANLPSPAKEQK